MLLATALPTLRRVREGEMRAATCIQTRRRWAASAPGSKPVRTFGRLRVLLRLEAVLSELYALKDSCDIN
jgi:hypothetical protein